VYSSRPGTTTRSRGTMPSSLLLQVNCEIRLDEQFPRYNCKILSQCLFTQIKVYKITDRIFIFGTHVCIVTSNLLSYRTINQSWYFLNGLTLNSMLLESTSLSVYEFEKNFCGSG
jgi:hypothetical protein